MKTSGFVEILNRVARWFVFKLKNEFGHILEGLGIKKKVGTL
jgi:hypothetical protein